MTQSSFATRSLPQLFHPPVADRLRPSEEAARRSATQVTFCVRGVISPVLSNVYLHFTLDLWFEKKFKSQCRGEAYLVRFADDFVGCFQFQDDAQNFQRQLRERFARFNLELAE